MAWFLVFLGCLIGAALSGADGSLILGLLIGGGAGRLIAFIAHLGQMEGAKILEFSKRKRNDRSSEMQFRKDQFTGRACQAMQLAREEARNLNHDYLAVEHLLLGLSRSRSGMLDHMMRELFVPDHETLVEEIARLGGRGSVAIDSTLPPSYSPRLRRVLQRAIAIAAESGHEQADTEHLLTALLLENDGVATRILRTLSSDFDDSRRMILEHLDHAVVS